jgi:predicted NUDIX family phosphoesterase
MTDPQAEELVYVVPRAKLFDGPPWRGVKPGDEAAMLALIEREGSFVPRSAAEVDPSLKQIIPYLVLRDRERIFLMHRTRAGGDERLHGLYSIGVGGHLNPGDQSVRGGLAREWHEELEADFLPPFEHLGLLNDDSVEVGSVHLGVVYVADAGGRSVRVRETDKLSGSFEPIEVVRLAYERMETWSQLILDALTAGAWAPAALGPASAAAAMRTSGRGSESHP